MTFCRQFSVLRRCLFAFWLGETAIILLLSAATLRAVPASGPLRVLPQNPRYFTDGSGKAVYLSGSHVWFNFKNIGQSDPPPQFDYDAYLAFLQQHNHNFVRLWTWELMKWTDGGSGFSFSDPFPWQRTGPGLAFDGRPKFDLSLFNQSYFDRLRSRVRAAGERGIYVSIMLFEGYKLRFSAGGSGSTGHPFHMNNNVNALHGDTDANGKPTEIQTLQNPAVTAVQKAYVRKVIDTVNDLDNVLYEIANESHPKSRAWQYEMIHFIKTYEAQLPKQHPVGMTSEGFGGDYDDTHDLFLSPADWISPSHDRYDYRNDPPAAIGDKVIIPDTDHLWGNGGNRAWVWKSFLRGLNPIFMDVTPPLNQGWVLAEGPEIRKAMGDTRKYAQRIDLDTMVPSGELASTTYCLANPGVEYLVYLPMEPHWSESWMESARFLWRFSAWYSTMSRFVRGLYRQTTRVDLTAMLGTASVEWFNPSTGETTTAGTILGGSKQDFTAPFGGDAVLHIGSVFAKESIQVRSRH
jgi:Family of unknown function (DUF6298)